MINWSTYLNSIKMKCISFMKNVNIRTGKLVVKAFYPRNGTPLRYSLYKEKYIHAPLIISSLCLFQKEENSSGDTRENRQNILVVGKSFFNNCLATTIIKRKRENDEKERNREWEWGLRTFIDYTGLRLRTDLYIAVRGVRLNSLSRDKRLQWLCSKFI